MREQENIPYSLRKKVEGKNLSTQTLLEMAQPYIFKPRPTAVHWEAAELLLTRALWQSTFGNASNRHAIIMKTLNTIIPEKRRTDPWTREHLHLELAHLRYQLSYTKSVERLVTDLLPQKRRLHQKLATALGNPIIMASALDLTLGLRQQFLISFDSMMGQLQSALKSVNVSLSSELLEEIKHFCDNPYTQLDDPYEENMDKFDKLFTLSSNLKKLSKRLGLEQLFKACPEEQLEQELEAQGNTIISQIVDQENLNQKTSVKVVTLNSNPMILRKWEATSLISTIESETANRPTVALEAVKRGLTLIAAIEDRKSNRERKTGALATSAEQLKNQLRSTINHIDFLSSIPCTNYNDIRLAFNLRQTSRAWSYYLSSSQLIADKISA